MVEIDDLPGETTDDTITQTGGSQKVMEKLLSCIQCTKE